MTWQGGPIDNAMYHLRLLVRGIWWVAGLVVAAFCLYVVARVCWHLAMYMDRTIFSTPW